MDEGFQVFLEDFTDFLNDLEASIAKMKQQIAKLVGAQSAYSWNSQAIRWEKAKGERGEYERCSDVENADFKALVKDLEAHDGKLTRDGFFYWLFSDGSAVGRKKRTVKKEA
ncbi:MAG: hypothetical protein QXD19_04080 [Candidatus Bathyarchaeia archaeon]